MKINMHFEEISPAYHGNQMYILEIEDEKDEVEAYFSIKNVQVKLNKQELMMIAKALNYAADRMM